MRTPSHHVYPKMARLGWKHCYTWKNPCHNNKEPHAIPCMPNLARKIHMQIDTCKESYCSCLILPFPTWSLLPLSFFAFIDPMQKCSKKTQVSKSERERERIMRELQNSSDKRLHWLSLPTDPQKPFYEWGLCFLHFPLFSFSFLLTCNLWPFTSFFS